jgi:hypothetical protein
VSIVALGRPRIGSVDDIVDTIVDTIVDATLGMSTASTSLSYPPPKDGVVDTILDMGDAGWELAHGVWIVCMAWGLQMSPIQMEGVYNEFSVGDVGESRTDAGEKENDFPRTPAGSML